jgi:REP element-mobilizing transposase RayT
MRNTPQIILLKHIKIYCEAAGIIPGACSGSKYEYNWRMSQRIHKPRNAGIIMCHIACPAKYRRAVIPEEAGKKLKEICLEIEKRHEIKFLEIGTEKDRVRFLARSVPAYSPASIAQRIKSIRTREIFEACPEVKKALWGGGFWTRGYYIGAVGGHGDEETTARHIRNQGRKPEDYEKTHENKQVELFS